MGVVDLPLFKGQWTWSNQSSRFRIDKIFVSANLLVDLVGVSHKTLARPISDHYPICIEADGIKWGLGPFGLDDKWLEKENFWLFVEKTWRNTVLNGCASYRFV